jgi:hypothetical protein
MPARAPVLAGLPRAFGCLHAAAGIELLTEVPDVAVLVFGVPVEGALDDDTAPADDIWSGHFPSGCGGA